MNALAELFRAIGRLVGPRPLWQRLLILVPMYAGFLLLAWLMSLLVGWLFSGVFGSFIELANTVGGTTIDLAIATVAGKIIRNVFMVTVSLWFLFIIDEFRNVILTMVVAIVVFIAGFGAYKMLLPALGDNVVLKALIGAGMLVLFAGLIILAIGRDVASIAQIGQMLAHNGRKIVVIGFIGLAIIMSWPHLKEGVSWFLEKREASKLSVSSQTSTPYPSVPGNWRMYRQYRGITLAEGECTAYPIQHPAGSMESLWPIVQTDSGCNRYSYNGVAREQAECAGENIVGPPVPGGPRRIEVCAEGGPATHSLYVFIGHRSGS